MLIKIKSYYTHLIDILRFYISGLYTFSLNEMKRRIISPLKQAVAARKRFRLFILSKNCMHKSRRAYSENKFRKHITCQEFAVLLFTLALDNLNLKLDHIFDEHFYGFSNMGNSMCWIARYRIRPFTYMNLF